MITENKTPGLFVGKRKLLFEKPELYREWHREPLDGGLCWRKSRSSHHLYRITKHNCTTPPSKGVRTPIEGGGEPFAPWLWPIRLENFVFVWDKNYILHLPSKSKFNSRQINERIFKDPALWPRTVLLDPKFRKDPTPWFDVAASDPLKPSFFIKWFNRVPLEAELFAALAILERGWGKA